MHGTIDLPDDDTLVQDTLRYFNSKVGSELMADEDDHYYNPLEAEVCMGMPQGGLMLDVGCGSGRSVEILFAMGVTRYLGVDYSATMLDIARTRFGKHHGVEFCQGDICELERVITKEKADAFVCVATLMQLPKRRVPQALHSIRSVVKTGAYGFITTPQGTETHILTHETKPGFPEGHRVLLQQWTVEELRRELAEAEFELEYSGGDCPNFMCQLLVRAV